MSFKPSIVQILVASDAFEGTYDDTYLSSTLSRCAEWGPRGDNIQSSPLVTWSMNYDDVVKALYSRGVKYEEMNVTNDYEFFATRAPQEYDYTGFGTIHLCTFPVDTSGKSERLVAVPSERMEYQLGRYASGMYSVRPVR